MTASTAVKSPFTKMETVTEIAKAKWNKVADVFNQWDDLGDDEREILVLRHLVEEFVECYFGRNDRNIKPVVEDACTILHQSA